MSEEDLLMIAASETNSNMYYATRFLAYDPVIYCRINGRSYLLLGDLDLDRGKEESEVDEVISWAEIKSMVAVKKKTTIKTSDVLDVFFREMKVKEIFVPSDFAIAHADELRRLGYIVHIKGEPYWPERMVKTPEEIEHIRGCQQATEHTLDHITSILRKTEIKDKRLFYNGEQLTSEFLRLEITLDLLKQGYMAKFVVVAGGTQAIYPDNLGSGPLPADEFIVFDIFHRSLSTFYWGDMSRTFVVGEPMKEMRRQYNAVLEAQEEALAIIKEGITGEEVHSRVCRFFEDKGYRTGMIDGRMQGFFHATGHGVGLELHEGPTLAAGEGPLREGNVVSVEPGLYYVATGGVRIEDLAAVTKNGIDNLNTYRKRLEP